MSPDLRRAYVRWSVLPGEEERMQRELARSAVSLRSAVAKMVALKHTPELHFRCDADVGGSEAERAMATAWEVLDRERELEKAEKEAAPELLEEGISSAR